MRQLLGLLSVGLLLSSIGCRHVGGKCDTCTAQPGELTTYAPYRYNTPTTGVSSGAPTTPSMGEKLGQPKEMPKELAK